MAVGALNLNGTSAASEATAKALRCSLSVLTPQSHAGGPAGAPLLTGATALLCGAGAGADAWPLALVQVTFSLLASRADLKLARHACVLLQRLPNASSGLTGVGTAREQAAAEANGAKGVVAVAITKAGGKGGAAAAAAAAAAADFEMAAEVVLLRSRASDALVAFLAGVWDGGDVESPHWYATAQSAIDCLFHISPAPIAAAERAVRAAAGGAFGGAGVAVSGPRAARSFFLVGHVAVKLLAHAEALASRVKLLRLRAAESGGGSAVAPAARTASPAKKSKGAASASASASVSASASAPAPPPPGPRDGIEDQLGAAAAAEDEREAEIVAALSETELARANLTGLFVPLLRATLERTLEGGAAAASVATLAAPAALSLAKLAAVCAPLAEDSLRLLFTVQSGSPSATLRALLSVALGDLAFRWPNLLEPYQSLLYARLRDDDPRVRKNSLMVLAHLILNDMIKVKGQVGELAVCLNDADVTIADVSKMVGRGDRKRSERREARFTLRSGSLRA